MITKDLEFSGRKLDLGGANIAEVLDMTTGKSNGTVTPGGMVQLKSDKIKCVNADGSGIGKLTLYNKSESGEEITVIGVRSVKDHLYIPDRFICWRISVRDRNVFHYRDNAVERTSYVGVPDQTQC